MSTLSNHQDFTHRVHCDRCGHDEIYLVVHDAVEDYRRHHLTCTPTDASEPPQADTSESEAVR